MPTQDGPGALTGATEANENIAEGRFRSDSTRLRLRQWRPVRRNTLRGFADVTLPIGLDIDVAVHVTGGWSWASLPGRPMLDGVGRALRDDSGKVRSALPVRWSTRGLASACGRRVVELVCAAHPDAFDDEGER